MVYGKYQQERFEMRKISKTEKQGILFLLIGVIAFAFLTDPITHYVSQTIPNSTLRLFIGISIIFAIAWFGKFNRVFK